MTRAIVPSRTASLRRGAALVAAVSALGGCADDNPVLGAWRSNQCALGPDPQDAVVCEQRIDFRGDGTLAYTATTTFRATSATTPGCRATLQASGLTWTSDSSTPVATLTLGGTPSGSVTRTDCTNAADNTAAPAPLPDPFPLVLGVAPYRIVDGMLLITVPNRGLLALMRP